MAIEQMNYFRKKYFLAFGMIFGFGWCVLGWPYEEQIQFKGDITKV